MLHDAVENVQGFTRRGVVFMRLYWVIWLINLIYINILLALTRCLTNRFGIVYCINELINIS